MSFNYLQEEQVNCYEMSFLASPSISSSNVENLMRNLVSIIDENGGTVLKRHYNGMLDLAYLIKKSNKAHLFVFLIKCKRSTLVEFTRKIKFHDFILRCLLLKNASHSFDVENFDCGFYPTERDKR